MPTAFCSVRVCLIATNSKSDRRGRLGICAFLTPKVRKRQVLGGLKGPLNLVLSKAEGLTDFGVILVFICKALKTKRICLCCYGVAKHQSFFVFSTGNVVFFLMHLKPAVLKNAVFDWEMCFYLCEVHCFQKLVSIKHTVQFSRIS